jgi:prefoldin subunit 5
MPLEYVKRQLNILEDIANDLRRQGDRLREEVRKMRQLISEDDF